MGREGRSHTICEEKAWYYAFPSTGTPINPLFIKYSLNSHFRTKCCSQDLKFVSPRIKKLVKILILYIVEKVAATWRPRGSRERLPGHSLTTEIQCKCTGRAAIFVADCKIQGVLMGVPWLLFRNQKPIFIFISYWDWLQKKGEGDLNWLQASRMLLRNTEV